MCQASSLFEATCNGFNTHYGVGMHIKYLSLSQVTGSMKWLTIGTLASFAGLFFLRASVAASVFRLLGKTHNHSRWKIHVATGLSAVITIFSIVVFIAQCRPFQAVWDKQIKGRCFSKQVPSDAVRIYGCECYCRVFTCLIALDTDPSLSIRHL